MNIKPIKCSAALALLLAMLFLIGCNAAPASDGTLENYENRLVLATNNSAFYYDGILYWLKSTQKTLSKLYCIDVNTGETMPLCGKPECSHDSESCNAYIDCDGRGFLVYDKKLYWLSNMGAGRTLWCAELDGGNRQKVMELDRDTERLVFDSTFVGIYGDRLFRCGCGSLVNNGDPERSLLLYSQPLKSGSEPTRLYYAENIIRVFSRISGNKLYFAVIGDGFSLELRVCDMDSGEVELLYSDSEPIYNALDLMVVDDRLILYGSGYRVFVYSITDGSFTVMEEEGRKYYYATETKLFEFTANNHYRLYDMEGELIADGAIDPPGFDEDGYYKHYIGCVGDTMYFNFVIYKRISEQNPFSEVQESIVTFNTETLEWSLIFDGRE